MDSPDRSPKFRQRTFSSSSTVGSDTLIDEETSLENKCFNQKTVELMILEDVTEFDAIYEIAQDLKLPASKYSIEAGIPTLPEDHQIIFVTNDFFSPNFLKIKDTKNKNFRIMSSVALRQCHERKAPLFPISHSNKTTALYCHHMEGIQVCFTGFRHHSYLSFVAQRVHCMGGKLFNEMVTKVTHLIAKTVIGDKARYAIEFRLPIVNDKWVQDLWEMRTQPDVNAHEIVKDYILKPLEGVKLHFIGFTNEEYEDMQKYLEEFGGQSVLIDDKHLTLIVVSDKNDTCMMNLEESLKNVDYVREEWFWHCIERKCFEKWDDYKITVKRKRQSQEALSPPFLTEPSEKKGLQLNDADITPSYLCLSQHSLQGSHESVLGDSPIVKDVSITPVPKEKYDKRFQTFLELLETESNYVSILDTVVNKIKKELEDHINNNDPLLDAHEIKFIFGNLPPIFEIHDVLKSDLEIAYKNWSSEDIKIGDIVSEKFEYDGKVKARTAYKRFIQDFEETKKQLFECDRSNARFHAFLKKCQCWKECRRQSLDELLIRPVQRLPSLQLLLKDLLKRTPESFPDHSALERCLQCIQDLMHWINEDKRQFDGKIGVLNALNEVENFPSELASSQKRSFVFRCEALDIEAKLSRKYLGLFLFTDVLVICKRRVQKIYNSTLGHQIRSPSTTSLHSQSFKSSTIGKPYKYLHVLELSNVVQIADLNECYTKPMRKTLSRIIQEEPLSGKDDKENQSTTSLFQNAFAILVNHRPECKPIWYAFHMGNIDNGADDKKQFLQLLKTQISKACSDERGIAIISATIQDLQLEVRNDSSIISELMHKTRKMSRNFSFKTPSKRLTSTYSTDNVTVLEPISPISMSVSVDNLKHAVYPVTSSNMLALHEASSVPTTPKLERKKPRSSTMLWKNFSKKFT